MSEDDHSLDAAIREILMLDRDLLDRLGNDADADQENRQLLAELAVAHRRSELDLTLSLDEAAHIAGMTSVDIQNLLAEGALIAYSVDGIDRIPRWQLTESGVLPGVSIIAAAIPVGCPIESLVAFLNIGNEDCDDLTPLTFIESGGDPAAVADLVRELDQC
ncbi:hypothetical protein ACK8HH_11915 [Gordonia sp. LUNF6]|uniref:hypothetical protein n=1 Tax=Gordonia sp. LUNF6 TaxID=3388658 RepID=UPI00399AF363